MSPWSNQKSAIGLRSTSKKHVTSISYKLEPAIWPCDTGQQIPCFDRCQLIVARMSNIKEVQSKPRLYVSVNLFWSMAAMLHDSVAVAVVVRTRSLAIPLAMITMRKSTHGFPFLSHDEYGTLLSGPSGCRSSSITYSCLRWLITVFLVLSKTKILMVPYYQSLSFDATIMVSKNCPITGEHVGINFVTQ